MKNNTPVVTGITNFPSISCSINFVGSKTYVPDLHYDIHHPGVAEEWMRKFPGKNWPVLAFTGAPASFPVQEQNIALHGHLFGKWAEELDKKVSLFSLKLVISFTKVS